MPVPVTAGADRRVDFAPLRASAGRVVATDGVGRGRRRIALRCTAGSRVCRQPSSVARCVVALLVLGETAGAGERLRTHVAGQQYSI